VTFEQQIADIELQAKEIHIQVFAKVFTKPNEKDMLIFDNRFAGTPGEFGVAVKEGQFKEFLPLNVVRVGVSERNILVFWLMAENEIPR